MSERSAHASLPRPDAARLVAGRGRYTDDIDAAHLGHVAFLRCPFPHARIDSIDATAARAATGVIAVITAADLATVCQPMQTKLALVPSHVSPPQSPLADTEACWAGEAVVAVVATSRAAAEDAIELIDVQWTELPAVGDLDTARAPDSAKTHSAMTSNLGLEHGFVTGDPDSAFRDAAIVVEHTFSFDRQTGVTLEPRTIIADYDPRLPLLTVHQSHQAPNQMRDVYATQLSLPLSAVRVVTPDVGGAFGLKLAAYPDELAVAAIAVLLRRPVKFVADRLESFVSDNHVREARVTAKLAVDAKGKMLAMDVAVTSGFGAYAAYPRGSVGEALQAAHMAAAPYAMANMRGSVRGYFQNKPPSGILRAVGQPIATTVTEQLIDLAAQRLKLDPAEIRRRNYAQASDIATKSAGGIVLSELSLDRCHERLLALMNYDALRAEQAELRKNGIHRGIGFAAFIEQTAVGPALYGPQGVRVSAHESCRLSLTPDGMIRCATSITDQGQGTKTGLAQVIAHEFGLAVNAVDVQSGDTQTAPFGGGAWASRGLALGGEAALRAARRLKDNILTIAASLLQTDSASLRIANGQICNAAGLAQMSLADLAATVAYRSTQIPLETLPDLELTESFSTRDRPYIAANGIQAAHLELDAELGTIRLLDFWVVDDCGHVVNPMLVDEQIRGGVVQGLGSALFEHCIYNDSGQLENGSLADYLVPMAGDMPDITIGHVHTPARATQLGARGVGEAGTVGAAAAVWTALNDALRPFGVTMSAQPFTPERVLDCIASAQG
jgi:carbon-monoxide dehydrogenase large subunit